MLAFLLLLSGYIVLGLACDRGKDPIREQPNPIIQIATGLTERLASAIYQESCVTISSDTRHPKSHRPSKYRTEQNN